MLSHQVLHDPLWQIGFPSHQVARGGQLSHLLVHLVHQGQGVVTCFLSLGPPDQCLVTPTPSHQGPHDLVLMGSADKDQGQDQWETRTPSPHLKADFKSHSLIQAHKHQNTLVCQKMDLLSRPPEDPIRHPAMTHLNKPQ